MNYVIANLHWFALLVGCLVIFHESGHFFVARALGIGVYRFSIGFGPVLWRGRWGLTEYTLCLLPFGGYVQLLGAEGEDVSEQDKPFAFSLRPIWQRVLVVLAGPLANGLLAWLVYTSLMVGEQKRIPAVVGLVSRHEAAAQLGLQPGDRIVQVADVPIDSWDTLRRTIERFPGQSLHLKWQRDGQDQEGQVPVGIRQIDDVFQEKQQRGKLGIAATIIKPMIAVVDSTSPAAQAGLRTGDLIKSIHGQPVATWDQVRKAILTADASQPLQLAIARGEQHLTLSLQPVPFPTSLHHGLGSAADTALGYTGLVTAESVIATLEAQTPAALSGLRQGDRLLALRLQRPEGLGAYRWIDTWTLDLGFVELEKDMAMHVLVQREQEVLDIPVTIAEQHIQDELRQTRSVLQFGAAYNPKAVETSFEVYDVPWWQACVRAWEQVGQDLQLLSRGLWKMASGTLPLNQLGGPIMLFVLAEKSAQAGWQTFLFTMGAISVNLGLMNLLPFPALDGGHLVLLALEGISRRKPSMAVLIGLQLAGVVFVLTLMIWVMWHDVLRFVMPHVGG